MKKRFSIALCFILLAAAGMAQADTSFRLIRTIPGDFTGFTVDNLDNVYLLNNRNQLKKISPEGDSVAIFNAVKKYGEVSLVDVSNPLKVLIYYRDFSTIVILDRFLNIRASIDLRKQNILQVKAIGLSYDNNIWLYDELDNKLKKINDEGKLLQETPDFRLLLGSAITPLKIFDEDKLVYLYDSAYGVCVFDYFGALKNNILIQHWHNFKVAGKYIYGSGGDTLFRYEISSFRLDEWPMPPAILNSRAFNFTPARLYALKEDGLEIYRTRR